MAASGRTTLTFSKKESLKGKKNIEELFKHGSSFYLHPILLKYVERHDLDGHNQILISVPKKKFKRAVDRNLLKRRIREAYRLCKNEYFTASSPHYHIAIIYLDQTKLPFSVIQDKLIVLLKRFEKIKKSLG
jgi:ribonuclease P protein component